MPATADVLLLRYSRSPTEPVSPSEFEALLAAKNLMVADERDEFLRSLDKDLAPNESTMSSTRLLLRGASVKVVDKHDSGSLSSLRTGDTDILSTDLKSPESSNSQIALYPSGGLGLRSLKISDLSFVLSQRNSRLIKIRENTSSSSYIVGDLREVVGGTVSEAVVSIERDTALVASYRATVRSDEGDEGSVPFFRRLIFQENLVDDSRESPLPQLFVKADFRKDVLTMLTVNLISSSVIDGLIEPESFSVPVDEGAVVVDSRESLSRPKVYVASRGDSDVIKQADRMAEPTVNVIERPAARRLFLPLSAGVGAALLAAFLFLGRKRSE
ncbi:hypothetical protein [Rhodopirellula islandica]|uniref:hypothetical protein n=1 Tax=Rhodopirellula islandica TaxID=595434 RepID=UPI0013649C26|nr:hypothetical protein [Rhodopirellula islandica]